jgi:hypothetical protein
MTYTRLLFSCIVLAMAACASAMPQFATGAGVLGGPTVGAGCACAQATGHGCGGFCFTAYYRVCTSGEINDGTCAKDSSACGFATCPTQRISYRCDL